MAKRTEEAAKLAGLIARKTGAPIEGSFEGNLQALINALNLHKVSNDHDQFSHVWTGFNQFLAGLETSGIMPVEAETADIGSPTRLFRKGFFSELSTLIFKKENVLVMDGTFVISKQSGKFPADVAAADTQVDFGQTLTAGDFLLLRAENKMEYMQVGALVSGTVYNVTRNLDGSGANDWPAESVYFVRGHNGDGWLELTAVDDLRLSVFTQGANWNQASEVVRVGKLDGWQGAGLTGYGLVMGNFVKGNYLSYSKTSGELKMIGGSLIAGNGNVVIDDDGLSIVVPVSTYDRSSQIKFVDGSIDLLTILMAKDPSSLTSSNTIESVGIQNNYQRILTSGTQYSNLLIQNRVGAKLSKVLLEATLGGQSKMTLTADTIQLNNGVVTAVATPYGLPQATASGKLDAGWIPNLSGVYLPRYGKAADADKLDGLDSTAFLQVPTWQAWTPSVVYLGGTTNPTSLTFDHARYCRTGNTVTFSIVATVVRGSGNRDIVYFTLPITAKYANFAGSCTEDVVTSTQMARGCFADTTARICIRLSAAMARDGKIRVSGSYEV